jgi:uncharacterized membrane-anchored protein YhcB (DUF1043 family)
MNDGLIGVICAIALASLATFGITQSVQSQRELEHLKIEFDAYQDGVKDSR